MYQYESGEAPKPEWGTFHGKYLPNLGGWRQVCAATYRNLPDEKKAEFERAAEEWNAERDEEGTEEPEGANEPAPRP